MTERKPLYQSPGQSGKRGFEDLECYKLALYVIAEIYKMVKSLPPEEKFDLAVQIRRSSKSVTSNIAEGYGRYHYLDSLYKYSIARGELNETLSHAINAKVLGYIDQSTFESLYTLIARPSKLLMDIWHMYNANVLAPGNMVIKRLTKNKQSMMQRLEKHIARMKKTLKAK